MRNQGITTLTSFNLVSFLGAICGIASLLAVFVVPLRPWLVATVFVLCMGIVWAESKRGRTTVFFSGVTRFYKHFPRDRTPEVFASVADKYCYLGVTFSTVLKDFEQWYSYHRPLNLSVRLLLTDPAADDVLEYQVLFAKGYSREKLTEAQKTEVAELIASRAQSIRQALSSLRELKAADGNIQVRLHRTKLREWMHIIDGELLYVGMLQKKDQGLESPAIVLRDRRHWCMFDHYNEWFESLWEDSASRAIELSARAQTQS